MKRLTLAAAMLAALTGLSLAGDWPSVGDQFRTPDETLLVVQKVKVHGDVDHSFVCMHRSGTRALDRSCTWMRIGALKGDWITYGGDSQAGVSQNPDDYFPPKQ